MGSTVCIKHKQTWRHKIFALVVLAPAKLASLETSEKSFKSKASMRRSHTKSHTKESKHSNANVKAEQKPLFLASLNNMQRPLFPVVGQAPRAFNETFWTVLCKLGLGSHMLQHTKTMCHTKEKLHYHVTTKSLEQRICGGTSLVPTNVIRDLVRVGETVIRTTEDSLQNCLGLQIKIL